LLHLGFLQLVQSLLRMYFLTLLQRLQMIERGTNADLGNLTLASLSQIVYISTPGESPSFGLHLVHNQIFGPCPNHPSLDPAERGFQRWV
jgi:hypothetical protein